MPRRSREHRAAVLQRLATRLDGANVNQSCLTHIAHAEGAPCNACGVRPEAAREPFLVVVPATSPAPMASSEPVLGDVYDESDL